MVQAFTQRVGLKALTSSAANLAGLVSVMAAIALTMGCAPTAQNSAVSNVTSGQGVVNGTDATLSDVSKNGLAESVVMVIGQQPAPPPSTGTNTSLCTGTLIAPQIVMTAAHCVSGGLKPENMVVGLHYTRAMQPNEDEQKENPLATGYHVKAFTIHPGYSEAGLGQQQDDIALMLLAKPVPVGTRIASLPEATANVDALDAVLAIGYGMSDEKHSTDEEHTGAGVLRYTTFEQGTFGVLEASADRKGPFDGMIASVASKTSVCHGDSGGPLMAVSGTASTNTVVGINDAVLPRYTGEQQTDYQAAEASGDMDGFYKKYPDANICSGGFNVFVNVAAQLPWINQTMAALLVQTTNPTHPVPQASPTPAPTPVATPVATPAPSPAPAKTKNGTR